jgi:hypothetical protein
MSTAARLTPRTRARVTGIVYVRFFEECEVSLSSTAI